MSVLSTRDFKSSLIRQIINNEEIFKLIDNPKAEYPDDLLGSKSIGCEPSVFSRIKVDFTIQQAGTYIGIKIERPSISGNKTFKNCLITMMVISHVNHVDLPKGGSRTDLIAEQLINMFNFNHVYDFEMTLVSDIEDPLNDSFYYRRLVFKCLEYNSLGYEI